MEAITNNSNRIFDQLYGSPEYFESRKEKYEVMKVCKDGREKQTFQQLVALRDAAPIS